MIAVVGSNAKEAAVKKLIPFISIVAILAIAALAGHLVWGDTIVWGASGPMESDYIVWGN